VSDVAHGHDEPTDVHVNGWDKQFAGDDAG